MSGKHSERANGDILSTGRIVIETPTKRDGAALWRIARDSQKLDLNSSYQYLLWCVDFADTSVVARVDGEAVGFVIAYRRPTEPDAALVWQVAVDASQRGRGLAGTLLDDLFGRLVNDGVRYLDTTITPDNDASIRLFASFAKRWNATLESSRLFEADDFPDVHEPEDLYRIGPLSAPPATVVSD
ncbi:diaminobutyrate acetyltransferase [Saccharomonospora piscinae]|uniref:L-2,4-diaminobutyric acid acetyltransferase n=1 Tax=Saccharomonospora piscinae TaxID=687388 RepID=A0A1V9A6T2_SACPI|nr:diaminobutyrate acetyltransferase [Saccharomonospora piscinae]OQO92770.1 diaminobutyrate acetyltransferase [Saccharomonospora piscinae]TLW91517.1 diaminobutyrate acetyltransferase [Saccharomonospora piscinae]